jgi:hypothetical protein
MKVSSNYHRELHMSWYNKRPVKNPPKPHTAPHRTSPVTEKSMKEAKKTGPQKNEKQ